MAPLLFFICLPQTQNQKTKKKRRMKQKLLLQNLVAAAIPQKSVTSAVPAVALPVALPAVAPTVVVHVPESVRGDSRATDR